MMDWILRLYDVYLRFEKVKIFPNRPWRPIGVFPVRYEHHLHIKSIDIAVTGHGDP
jgi:hypothetical protein